jgi:chromosome segregation ATPase
MEKEKKRRGAKPSRPGQARWAGGRAGGWYRRKRRSGRWQMKQLRRRRNDWKKQRKGIAANGSNTGREQQRLETAIEEARKQRKGRSRGRGCK